MQRRLSNALTMIGLLLIAAALFWAVHNYVEDHQAGKQSMQALERLLVSIPVIPAEPLEPLPSSILQEEIPDYVLNPEMEMPTESIDGLDYIGVLSIPILSLELPIVADWSYGALQVAPCRYYGSIYNDTMVIAGHNYTTHFASLYALSPGDEVRFTDVDGNVFTYRVALKDSLTPDAVEEMTQSDYALTLFSCTMGGQYRVTVRCDRIS